MIISILLVGIGVTIHVLWTNYRDGDVCHILLPTFDVPNIVALVFVLAGVAILVGAP